MQCSGAVYQRQYRSHFRYFQQRRQEVETDQEGTGYGNTHLPVSTLQPSILNILLLLLHLISDVNKALLVLFIVNLIHHCQVFVPLFCASTVVWCVVCGVQYFISGKIRSSCSIGSQSYHPTDQWTLPFYFLIRAVSTCQRVNSQHNTRGHFFTFLEMLN